MFFTSRSLLVFCFLVFLLGIEGLASKVSARPTLHAEKQFWSRIRQRNCSSTWQLYRYRYFKIVRTRLFIVYGT